MNHLKNFLDGFASVGGWCAPPRHYILPRNGFHKDHAKILGDAKRIGQDMKKALEKNGQNTQSRS
jgi:hypothetical protein